jgi:hypothetical protein
MYGTMRSRSNNEPKDLDEANSHLALSQRDLLQRKSIDGSTMKKKVLKRGRQSQESIDTN